MGCHPVGVNCTVRREPRALPWAVEFDPLGVDGTFGSIYVMCYGPSASSWRESLVVVGHEATAKDRLGRAPQETYFELVAHDGESG